MVASRDCMERGNESYYISCVEFLTGMAKVIQINLSK